MNLKQRIEEEIKKLISENKELLEKIMKEEYEDIICHDTYTQYLMETYRQFESNLIKKYEDRPSTKFEEGVYTLTVKELKEMLGDKYDLRSGMDWQITFELRKCVLPLLRECAFSLNCIDANKRVNISLGIQDLQAMKKYIEIGKEGMEEDHIKWELENTLKKIQNTIDTQF